MDEKKVESIIFGLKETIKEQKAEIKRLTEENEYLDMCGKQFLADYQKCEIERAELQKQVDELEDKIEQGTLVELPCKVGDTIWVIDEEWGYREDGTWGSTSEMHEGKVYSFTYYGNCLHVEDDFTSNVYLWGEEAFLTREEAEKRLEELQG